MSAAMAVCSPPRQPSKSGRSGRLEVALRDGHHTDAVFVCRTFRVNGRAWPNRIAARFLPAGPFGISLRQFAGRGSVERPDDSVEQTHEHS
jgi:hypothetical protein